MYLSYNIYTLQHNKSKHNICIYSFILCTTYTTSMLPQENQNVTQVGGQPQLKNSTTTSRVHNTINDKAIITKENRNAMNTIYKSKVPETSTNRNSEAAHSPASSYSERLNQYCGETKQPISQKNITALQRSRTLTVNGSSSNPGFSDVKTNSTNSSPSDKRTSWSDSSTVPVNALSHSSTLINSVDNSTPAAIDNKTLQLLLNNSKLNPCSLPLGTDSPPNLNYHSQSDLSWPSDIEVPTTTNLMPLARKRLLTPPQELDDSPTMINAISNYKNAQSFQTSASMLPSDHLFTNTDTDFNFDSFEFSTPQQVIGLGPNPNPNSRCLKKYSAQHQSWAPQNEMTFSLSSSTSNSPSDSNIMPFQDPYRQQQTHYHHQQQKRHYRQLQHKNQRYYQPPPSPTRSRVQTNAHLYQGYSQHSTLDPYSARALQKIIGTDAVQNDHQEHPIDNDQRKKKKRNKNFPKHMMSLKKDHQSAREKTVQMARKMSNERMRQLLAKEAAGEGYAYRCLVCLKQFRSRVGYTYHARQAVCSNRAKRKAQQAAQKQQKLLKKAAKTAKRRGKKAAAAAAEAVAAAGHAIHADRDLKEKLRKVNEIKTIHEKCEDRVLAMELQEYNRKKERMSKVKQKDFLHAKRIIRKRKIKTMTKMEKGQSKRSQNLRRRVSPRLLQKRQNKRRYTRVPKVTVV